MREHIIFPLLSLCLFFNSLQIGYTNTYELGDPPFTFTSEHVTIDPGFEVCIDYTVKNFADILSFQFGVTINTNLLNFVEIKSDILIDNELFADLPTTGDPIVTVSWGSLSGIPLSVSDGSVLFSLCFNLSGTQGGCSPLAFSELPGAEQGARISVATANQEYYQDDIIFNDGSICSGMISDIISFDADNDGSPSGKIQTIITGGQPPYMINVVDCNGDDVTFFTIETPSQNYIVEDLYEGFYCVEILDSANPPNQYFGSLQLGSCNIPVLTEFGVGELTCPNGSDGSLEVITEPTTIPINSYSWSDGSQTYSGNPITQIPAGDYFVTISDAIGCSILEQVSLEDQNAFEIDLSASLLIDPVCNGDENGSIHVFVNGGTPPYTYELQNGVSITSMDEAIFETLDSGDYTISVHDANGCEVETQVFTLNNPGIIFGTIQTTICEGESFEGYSVPGSYVDVLTSDVGCDSIRTLVLSLEKPDTTMIEAIICEGEEMDGYTSSGTYIDIMTGINGCDSTRTLVLEVIPNILTTVTDTICEGESFEGYTETGIYEEIFEASNGCDSICTIDLTVLPITNVFCTGTATTDFNLKNHLEIYPNPAQDIIYLIDEDLIYNDIQLLTADGKILKEAKIQRNLSMDISQLPQAVYLIKGINDNGSEIIRFIKF